MQQLLVARRLARRVVVEAAGHVRSAAALRLPHRRRARICLFPGERRDHDVIHQRLLVGVGIVGLPRPRHVPADRVRLPEEEVHAPRQLAQHPRSAVGRRD
eukprot:6578333-Prymnesium_polylepis.1